MLFGREQEQASSTFPDAVSYATRLAEKVRAATTAQEVALVWDGVVTVVDQARSDNHVGNCFCVATTLEALKLSASKDGGSADSISSMWRAIWKITSTASHLLNLYFARAETLQAVRYSASLATTATAVSLLWTAVHSAALTGVWTALPHFHLAEEMFFAISVTSKFATNDNAIGALWHAIEALVVIAEADCFARPEILEALTNTVPNAAMTPTLRLIFSAIERIVGRVNTTAPTLSFFADERLTHVLRVAAALPSADAHVIQQAWNIVRLLSRDTPHAAQHARDAFACPDVTDLMRLSLSHAESKELGAVLWTAIAQITTPTPAGVEELAERMRQVVAIVALAPSSSSLLPGLAGSLSRGAAETIRALAASSTELARRHFACDTTLLAAAAFAPQATASTLQALWKALENICACPALRYHWRCRAAFLGCEAILAVFAATAAVAEPLQFRGVRNPVSWRGVLLCHELLSSCVNQQGW